MFGREKTGSRGEHEGTEEIRNLFEEDNDDEPKLIEEGDCVKTWRFAKSLKSPLT